MGKRADFVPGLVMEDYMNERRIPLEFGADAGVAVGATVLTGLEMELSGDSGLGGLKWVLFGATYQPASLGDYPDPAIVGRHVFQLQARVEVAPALLDAEDERVICSGGYCADRETSGALGLAFPLPMDILHPKPLIRKQYQMVMQAVDNTSFNSLKWVVKLYWGVDPLNAGDAGAVLQAAVNNAT